MRARLPLLSVFLPLLPGLAYAACRALPNPLPPALAYPDIEDLPNPWQCFDGTPLKSRADWPSRKAQILTLVQENFYGYYPDHKLERVHATRSGNSVNITVETLGKTAFFNVTLDFPSGVSPRRRVPVVISAGPPVDNSVFLNSGVGMVFYDTDLVAADSPVPGGAFWELYSGRDIAVLTAWAWGYHRIIDAFAQVVPEVDPKRIGVMGCSRWGKGALAAGIFDERIALTLPMSSGLEGIAPFRFHFEQNGANEHIENIFGVFPYWSNTQLGEFVGNVTKLPFDANSLTSLVAPRALIWDEGITDYWTNPEGVASVTFPATQAVYEWLGAKDKVGIALRTNLTSSGHCDISGYANIKDFMNTIFFGSKTKRDYSDIAPFTSDPSAFPWATSPPKGEK